jgi:metallo-beta-lactamase family protein
VLVDCGLFQGFKQLRLRNWAPFPVPPASIDAVVLTHAHLDHSGAIPLLARGGFRGPVLATPPTRDLCGILLPDSGNLQERDAEFANRHGFSKHRPAQPLYTRADAEACLALFRDVEFDRDHAIAPGLSLRFLVAGHILGAAMAMLTWQGRRWLFSGDLGRVGDPTMPDPAQVEGADLLLVESTYGDRRHDPRDAEDVLAEIILRTAGRSGTVLIPAFAVGRTQAILYHLHRLKAAHRIPDLPIFVDSPMATDATALLQRHPLAHRLPAAECRATCGVARYTRGVEESKAIDASPYPKVVISASGMATGGRVLHHIKAFGPDRRNTILFSGFQAGGTRGAQMLAGVPSVKIHGHYVPIAAEVADLPMLSAHADADGIMAWLRGFTQAPRQTYVVHGEPNAADTLRHRIEEELGWPARVPEHGEMVTLP